MKVRDIPKSGRDGDSVYCHRAGTAYVRVYVKPTDPKTDHQHRVREILATAAKRFGTWLTEPEREEWNAAAEKLSSRPRLGRSGPLTGEVLFAKLNCPRELIGREWLRRPTAPVVFGPSPVGELTLRREQGRLRLELAVSGPVIGDIMVFATPPCPATWTKCRKARFLGRLPSPVNGVCDISALYLERFGEPEPGQRIFVRTLQQRDGWESDAVDTNNLVPVRELCVAVAPGTAGTTESEHPNSNRQPPKPNPPGVGAWRLSFGASLELGAWNLELSCPPCPWEIHAVHTVSAPWFPLPRQAVWSGIPPPIRRWRVCQLGATARNSANGDLSSSRTAPEAGLHTQPTASPPTDQCRLWLRRFNTDCAIARAQY